MSVGPAAAGSSGPVATAKIQSVSVLCRFEIDHLGKKTWKGDEALRKAVSRRGKVTHYVTICTATVRDTKPRVDVYVTLIGQRDCDIIMKRLLP